MNALYFFIFFCSVILQFSEAQTSLTERTKQSNNDAYNRNLRGASDAVANAEFRRRQLQSLIGTTQQKKASSPAASPLNLPTSSFNKQMSYFNPQRNLGLRATYAPRLSSTVINTIGGLTKVISQAASASSQVRWQSSFPFSSSIVFSIVFGNLLFHYFRQFSLPVFSTIFTRTVFVKLHILHYLYRQLFLSLTFFTSYFAHICSWRQYQVDDNCGAYSASTIKVQPCHAMS